LLDQSYIHKRLMKRSGHGNGAAMRSGEQPPSDDEVWAKSAGH